LTAEKGAIKFSEREHRVLSHPYYDWSCQISLSHRCTSYTRVSCIHAGSTLRVSQPQCCTC